MGWFGYLWLVMLVAVYCWYTVSALKDAIRRDFDKLTVWIVAHMLVLFLFSLSYFCYIRGGAE